MLQTAIANKNVPTPKVVAKVIEKTKTRLSSMATPPGFSSATQRVTREVTCAPSIVSVIIISFFSLFVSHKVQKSNNNFFDFNMFFMYSVKYC